MSEKKYRTLVMQPTDSVAVSLQDIPQNEEVDVNLSGELSKRILLKDEILFGHKFAIKAIQKGETILKYGEIIGKAIRDIAEGEHVHVHNLEGIRGRGDQIGTK
ncbi:UxaA family hydrolase [Fredinandcohnia salidurans]|uniref:UxaA family hydrolase n=1 Tax=Fredinandcohnia salidurans TaxID=2595041 RepID=A0ABW4MRA2_9BACI